MSDKPEAPDGFGEKDFIKIAAHANARVATEDSCTPRLDDAILWAFDRIKKLEEGLAKRDMEIGLCHRIITNGVDSAELAAYVFDIPPIQIEDKSA